MVSKFVKLVFGYFMYNNARDVAVSIENAFYNVRDVDIFVHDELLERIE